MQTVCFQMGQMAVTVVKIGHLHYILKSKLGILSRNGLLAHVHVYEFQINMLYISQSHSF